MFDDTLAGHWDDVSAELKGIDQRLSELPANLPFPDVVAVMHDRIRSLRQGVPAHDTLAVLNDANALTRLATQIADKAPNSPPANQPDLRAMWMRAEPMVLMRGDTADGRRFTDIVVDLESARSPSDFKRLAKTELDAAGSLSRRFESGG